MKLSDIIFILMFISFFWFNEGIIARAPRWQKLVDNIELNVISLARWRANADIRRELDLLIKHFKFFSILAGGALFFSMYFRFYIAMKWFSPVFLFCFTAWFSFKWTFRHGEAVHSFSPMFMKMVLGPWAMYVLDLLVPNIKLMSILGAMLRPFPIHPGSDLEVALWVSGGVLAIFFIYYILAWILFSPFAYFVLASLKLSSIFSNFALKHLKRKVVFELAVAIQVLGGAYFYFLSR